MKTNDFYYNTYDFFYSDIRFTEKDIKEVNPVVLYMLRANNKHQAHNDSITNINLSRLQDITKINTRSITEIQEELKEANTTINALTGISITLLLILIGFVISNNLMIHKIQDILKK